MPSEASVMPNWQADRYSLMSSSWRAARRRAASRPASGQLLEARAARAHERELGRDEEPVDQRRAASTATSSSAVIARRRCEPLLRGRSSGTLIRRGEVPAAERQQSADRRSASSEPVERSASAKSAVGDAALGVRRERQPDLVPAVDEDVRMVVGRLGDLGDAVRRTRSPRRSRRTRGRARSRRPRAATRRPPGARRSPRRSSSVIIGLSLPCTVLVDSVPCGSSASSPTRPSCCSRSGSATTSSASRTSATIPPRRSRAAARHARRAARRA